MLNYTAQEMKLDFTTRLVPLPGNRILVCDEKADWHMLALKFDQADLDVAEVIFTPIQCDERITPSKIAVFWQTQPEDSAGTLQSLQQRNISVSQDFTIFVGSHYHDCGLLSLKPFVKEDEVEEPVTKRPRLSSGEQPRKRKVLVPAYEPLRQLDTLPVVSAITDCV